MLCLALASGTPAPSRWLTPREQSVRAAHRDPVRRREWLLGRIAAKCAVGALVGVHNPKRVEVTVAESGEPRARIRTDKGIRDLEPFAISITHCDGRAVAAARRTHRVGVDLERQRTIIGHHGRYFLTPHERTAFQGRDLTVLWAVKEAAWKALGCGIDTPFHALELRIDHMGRVRRVVLNSIAQPARVAVLHQLPGYVLALVLTGVTP